MYVTGICAEWFWLVPLIGMLLMIGVMFFMCRNGFKMRTMGRCGCKRVKNHQGHHAVGDAETLPSDSHQN